LQSASTEEFRTWAPQQYDQAVIQLANLMREINLCEHAHDLLRRHLQLQTGLPDGNPWPAAIRLGYLVEEIDRKPQAQEYTDDLLEQYELAGGVDPQSETDFWSYLAVMRWNAGDLKGAVQACQRGFMGVGDLDADSLVSATASLHRVRGWARISLEDIDGGLADLEQGYDLVVNDAGFVSTATEYRGHTQAFLQVRGIDAWRLWQQKHAPLPTSSDPRAGTIDVQSEWVAAYASRLAGDYAAATALLGDGVDVAFGWHYDALNYAVYVMEWSSIKREQPEDFRPGVLLEILRRVNEALKRIDELPEELRSLPRVLSCRNALWIQKANALGGAGQTQKAIELARRAAESDATIYGYQHGEYADDVHTLAESLEMDQALTGRPRGDEARIWYEVARDIYATPGPHQDLIKAQQVIDSIEGLGS
jgi:tetratricopeptide (TPR) repeat protein